MYECGSTVDGEESGIGVEEVRGLYSLSGHPVASKLAGNGVFT